MKGIKNVAALGLSLMMLSGCVTMTFTTNPYSDSWGKKYIPTPRLSRRTIYGSLKKKLREKRTGYLVLTMHPESLNDLKMYRLNLNKKIDKKDLDEIVFDTYNNVALGISKGEVVKAVTIKEKGYHECVSCLRK